MRLVAEKVKEVLILAASVAVCCALWVVGRILGIKYDEDD